MTKAPPSGPSVRVQLGETSAWASSLLLPTFREQGAGGAGRFPPRPRSQGCWVLCATCPAWLWAAQQLGGGGVTPSSSVFSSAKSGVSRGCSFRPASHGGALTCLPVTGAPPLEAVLERQGCRNRCQGALAGSKVPCWRGDPSDSTRGSGGRDGWSGGPWLLGPETRKGLGGRQTVSLISRSLIV